MNKYSNSIFSSLVLFSILFFVSFPHLLFVLPGNYLLFNIFTLLFTLSSLFLGCLHHIFILSRHPLFPYLSPFFLFTFFIPQYNLSPYILSFISHFTFAIHLFLLIFSIFYHLFLSIPQYFFIFFSSFICSSYKSPSI